MIHRRSSGDRELGAAAVELALVLPMLLLLVFGIVDFGRAYNAKISLTQAAREGARVESLRANINGDTVFDDSDVVARVDQATGLSVDTSVESTCGIDPVATDIAEVKVTYQFEFSPFLKVFANLVLPDGRLEGVGVMRCLG